jgi:hypothetical protein
MSAHQTDAAADPAATARAAAYPRRWLAAVVMIGAALMDMAFMHGLPVTAGLFLAAAALSLMLPRTA